MTEYAEQSVAEFCDTISAETSAPGGGSVAAVVGSMAASLAAMAARFSKEQWEDAAGAVAQAEALRARLLPLAEEDARAYENVLLALRMPKEVDEEVRDAAIGDALSRATYVPLAIAEPERQFTLIESRAKRVHFLRHVVGELKLKNTSVAHSRAEDLHVERPFDTVLARAVAPPAELLSVCRHLTAPGSVLLLLTAAHLEGAFHGLAPDFVVRPVRKVGPVLRSTIVLLERIDA